MEAFSPADAAFICANEVATIETIRNMPTGEFVRRTNQIVAEQAERLVFGKDDKALAFVEKHLRKRLPKAM